MSTDRDDGFRFVFIQLDDNRARMQDTLEEYPEITMPINLSHKLADLLAEQHNLREDKQNQLTRFKGILEIIQRKQNAIDKDLLIAVINRLNFIDVSEED